LGNRGPLLSNLRHPCSERATAAAENAAPEQIFRAHEKCVFFDGLQAINTSLESGRRHDEIASGCAIYAYVKQA
jgi:hypothetical protein